MSKHSIEERWNIISLHKQGHSQRVIQSEVNIPQQTISDTIKRYKTTGSVDDKKRSGRPKKLSASQETNVVALSKGKRHRSTRIVAKMTKKNAIPPISRETVRKTLKNHDLKPYHRPKKQRLNSARKNKRLKFAIDEENRNWKNVVFSDEKKWILFDTPNKQNDIVWCGEPSEVPAIELEKWKVVVHSWGCICYNGTMKLVFYEPPLDAKKYQDILLKNLLPAAKHVFQNKHWVFQQDGAKCHSAASTQQWLEANVPSFIPKESWPPNSPDINPIERVWAIMLEKLEKTRAKTVKGFKNCINKIWKFFEISTIRQLYDD